MEKELLQKKKEEVISLNNILIRNEEQIEDLEKENEKLTEDHKKIIVELDKLDKVVFRYERLKDAKKIILLFFILGVVFGLVSGIFSLIEQVTILSTVFSFISPIVVSTLISSIPYIGTKLYISNSTNLTFEEVLKQIEDLKYYKKANREKYKKNTEKIENIKFNTSFMYSNFNSLILNLLKDKEARDEIMNQIMEKEPSKELVEIVANDIVKTLKLK